MIFLENAFFIFLTKKLNGKKMLGTQKHLQLINLQFQAHCDIQNCARKLFQRPTTRWHGFRMLVLLAMRYLQCIARAVYKCSVQVNMQPYKCIHFCKCIQFDCKESSAWSRRTAKRCFGAIPLLVLFAGMPLVECAFEPKYHSRHCFLK